MRRISRWYVTVPIVALLLAWAPLVLARADEGSTTEDLTSRQVLLLDRDGRHVQGVLKVTSDGLVFQAEEGEDAERIWSYDTLRSISLKHARLLELELRTGDKVKLASFGAERFDEDFAKVLRETVKGDVRIRS